MGVMTISVVIGAILLILSIIGVGNATAADPKTDGTKKAGEPAKGSAASNPAKAEVLKRLKKLADTEPPKKLAPGAMCYDMAMPPQRAEYVCPTCSEKTLYVAEKGKWDSTTQFISWELQACRRKIKQIHGLKVSLDESALCKKCQPNAKMKELALLIDYGDPKAIHRVTGITLSDLVLVNEFLDGKLKHDGGQGGEIPLKNFVKRLEELLGVKLESPKKVKE